MSATAGVLPEMAKAPFTTTPNTPSPRKNREPKPPTTVSGLAQENELFSPAIRAADAPWIFPETEWVAVKGNSGLPRFRGNLLLARCCEPQRKTKVRSYNAGSSATGPGGSDSPSGGPAGFPICSQADGQRCPSLAAWRPLHMTPVARRQNIGLTGCCTV